MIRDFHPLVFFYVLGFLMGALGLGARHAETVLRLIGPRVPPATVVLVALLLIFGCSSRCSRCGSTWSRTRICAELRYPGQSACAPARRKRRSGQVRVAREPCHRRATAPQRRRTPSVKARTTGPPRGRLGPLRAGEASDPRQAGRPSAQVVSVGAAAACDAFALACVSPSIGLRRARMPMSVVCATIVTVAVGSGVPHVEGPRRPSNVAVGDRTTTPGESPRTRCSVTRRRRTSGGELTSKRRRERRPATSRGPHEPLAPVDLRLGNGTP